MMKKIFGMAAISALAFSMFACSGEDGADGINGKDGKDGADGVSCTVKALKDKSGFKVVCDGDSVGVLKNGTDGKDGKDGTDGKDGADGEDGANGSGKAGNDGANGKDGTSCTAKAVTDGFKIICGTDTVGTLKNGTDGDDGDPGENCTLEDIGDGTVAVTCGATTINLFKALCNATGDGSSVVPYDPETQLCTSISKDVEGVIVRENVSIPKCADQWEVRGIDGDASEYSYDPTAYFCDNGVLALLCGVKDKDGKISMEKYKAKTQYCDAANFKIADKVPCSEGNTEFYTEPGKYCYRNAATPKNRMLYKDSARCGSGENAKRYSPVTHFCKSTAGDLGTRDICAQNKASADKFDLSIRYMSEENMDSYNGQICDTRDYQIYDYNTKGDYKFMSTYLKYAYLKPTKDLDSSSFCYMNDCTADENYDGRAYLWSAVIDSTELDKGTSPKVCGYGKDACTFTAPYRGVCPAGWHVPSKAEVDAVDIGAGSRYGAFAHQQNPAAGTREKRRVMVWDDQVADDESSDGELGYTDAVIWTIEDASDVAAKPARIDNGLMYFSEHTYAKYYALPVRCFKD